MRLRFFSTIRQLVGKKEIEIRVDAPDTIRNVLEKLAVEHPALKESILDNDGNLYDSILVFINGRNIKFLDGLNSTIKEGDQLAIFPLLGGG
jgi:molybdopterin synthase sulfur carrier subunit